jgi:hypothetical protein
MSTLRVNNIKNAAGTQVATLVNDTVELAAGTTTRPPLVFTAGPSLTTPHAGAIEYNGRGFYTTPDATAGKAFNVSEHLYSLSADTLIQSTVVANTWYPAFGVGLQVASDSSYVVDVLIGLRTGATSHTVSFHFGGTATFSDCQFRTEFTNLALSTGVGAAGVPTAPGTLMFVTNPVLTTNAVISPASTLVSKFFRVHGIITIGTGGTIIPEIAFSANPTGTNQVTRLSYVKLNAVGTSTGVLQAGNWV